ncbi:hypothetical protein G6O69_29725 [Pseudenhygromyxa sp. WMMC2535]|uniref:hypothetical protein n=1 Tax=Pseudenhygromyxa sp. WMMC2535 TaxID=2712867 RepID=UPI001553613B|nr:hypothetical protein [Pseudenhygromyxa sp. WMMC2535]NVB42042.1 hypothetical protein [Pseudenhygromyxa sp. WMMC2535]
MSSPIQAETIHAARASLLSLGLTLAATACVHVLMLAELGSIIRLDHTQGTVELVATVPEQWADVTLALDSNYWQWLTLDHEQQRLFLTARTTQGLVATVRIDLDTLEQTLLYDGAAIEGHELDCVDDVAFDSLRNQILYHNLGSSVNCEAGYYAVDVATSEGELLFLP